MYGWPFRRVVRLVWWLLCTLVLLSIPYTLWSFKESDYDSHYVGYTTAGIFVLLAMPVTIYQIALHVNYYNEPQLQRHVVRIVLMVPIYAVVSWSSLRWLSCRKWLSPLRECYEAVVLYSFLLYLVGCLQKKTGDYDLWLSTLPPQHPLWPFQGRLGSMLGVRTIESGHRFAEVMRRGVLAFVFVRPFLAVVQVLSMMTGVWEEGDLSLRQPWLWCILLNNVAQFWAIYCLVALYHATSAELADIHPLRKFVLIKMVVFFTFWQGMALGILGYFHVIGQKSWTTYKTKELAGGIQDVIICVESLPASLLFAVAFPARDYMRPGQQPGTFIDNVVDMFDIRDVGRDVTDLVEDQVHYARTVAATGVLDAATAATSIAKKPARLARAYFSTPSASGAVLHTRRDGHALQPLLSSFEPPAAPETP